MTGTEAEAILVRGEARLAHNRKVHRRRARLWRVYDLLDAARREFSGALIVASKNKDRGLCLELMDAENKILARQQRALELIDRVQRGWRLD